MKRFYPRLAAKLCAFLLLGLCAFAFTLGVEGVHYLWQGGVYADGGVRARYDLLSGSRFSERMDEAQDYLEASLLDGYDAQAAYLRSRFAEENSNFYFTAADEDGALLLGTYVSDDAAYSETRRVTCLKNRKTVHETRYFDSYFERWAYIEDCQRQYRDVQYSDWDADSDGDGTYECGLEIVYTTGEPVTVWLTGTVKNALDAHDEFYSASRALQFLAKLRWVLPVLCALLLALGLGCFVFLLCAAGVRADGRVGWVERVPLDVFVILELPLSAMAMGLTEGIWSRLREGLYVFVAAEAIAGLAVTFSARAKAGRWWRNTVLWRLVALLVRLGRLLWSRWPLLWRAGLGWLGLCLAELLGLAVTGAGEWVVLGWFLEKLLLTPLVLLFVLNLKRLREGGDALAAGEMNHVVPLAHMLPELRRQGERLNAIRDGLRAAVEKQMKAEHLKTELITNVSHDIKTPLTSIVSYVDLLKREGLDAPAAPEYLDALDRQSARLKKLTMDLVEASKASSGSVSVQLERVDLNLLLDQAAGEYSDRFSARGLTAVPTPDPLAPAATADGRLLWRVLDNLLSNAAKYAQPGTRVYLATAGGAGSVAVTVKNVSAAPLNLPAEELMERFVRGDLSRSSEGSGLGLSIARSLTELMGGTLTLDIDGDLFKATVTLPAA